MIIRDERHYHVTLAHVIRFRAALKDVEAELPTHPDPDRSQANIDCMLVQLDALERALREYESRTR